MSRADVVVVGSYNQDQVWVTPTLPVPGETRLGAVRYEFDGDGVQAAIVGVPGLAEHWIDDLVDEVYPAHSDTRSVR